MFSSTGVVIVCAGRGRRLGADKAAIKLQGKPLFCHTYELFRNLKAIEQIVIVLRKKNFCLAQKFINDKRVSLVEGGLRRQDSVLAGLRRLNKNIKYVLIHDGARPFTPKETILAVIKNVKRYPAVICAVRPKDTLKKASGNFVKSTLDRGSIVMVQTPQAFRKDMIIKAYEKFNHKNSFDDAQLFEFMKRQVRVIEGSYLNMKITYPQDIVIANAILGKNE